MLSCPACRNAVDVPEDYDAESIRCGICWAEIAWEPKAKPAEVIEQVLEAAPAVKADPFLGIAGRPAYGMASLEVLLRSVAEKLPGLFHPAPMRLTVQQAELPTAMPKKAARKPQADEGLRRKRGSASSMAMPECDGVPAPRSSKATRLIYLCLTVVAFSAAFFLLRRFIK